MRWGESAAIFKKNQPATSFTESNLMPSSSSFCTPSSQRVIQSTNLSPVWRRYLLSETLPKNSSRDSPLRTTESSPKVCISFSITAWMPAFLFWSVASKSASGIDKAALLAAPVRLRISRAAKQYFTSRSCPSVQMRTSSLNGRQVPGLPSQVGGSFFPCSRSRSPIALQQAAIVWPTAKAKMNMKVNAPLAL